VEEDGTPGCLPGAVVASPLSVAARPVPPRIPAHILELDGFRAIAIYLVINFHFGVYVRIFPPYNVVTQAGWVGVPLFFVLSGMLLSLPFITAGLEGRPGPSAARFYQRRVLRIFPLYYGSLLLLVAATGLAQHAWPAADELVSHLFFVSNFRATFSTISAPYWSLAVEVQFYVVMPLIGAALYRLVRARRTRAAAGLLLGLAALSLAYRIFVTCDTALMARRGFFFLVYASTLSNFDAFATGMLCALAYALAVQRDVPMVPRGAVAPAVVASLVVVYLLMHFDGGSTFKSGASTWFAPSLFYTLLNAAWGLCIAATLSLPSMGWARFLRSPLMVFVSTISYGLYIWHTPVKAVSVHLLSRVATGRARIVALLLVETALTFAVSTLGYRWLERPFLRAKRRG
jgi:peptidoglycan/LPS O-acetylase OafA/YrhL